MMPVFLSAYLVSINLLKAHEVAGRDKSPLTGWETAWSVYLYTERIMLVDLYFQLRLYNKIQLPIHSQG